MFFKKNSPQTIMNEICFGISSSLHNMNIKQESQIMHLVYIMNIFQYEEDKVEFKLSECLNEEI